VLTGIAFLTGSINQMSDRYPAAKMDGCASADQLLNGEASAV
jgi:hypothetical protein